jgi:hypothetical protein
MSNAQITRWFMGLFLKWDEFFVGVEPFRPNERGAILPVFCFTGASLQGRKNNFSVYP